MAISNPEGIFAGTGLSYTKSAMLCRVDGHLVDPSFVAAKVGSSSYPTGQQGSYSNSPPASGIL